VNRHCRSTLKRPKWHALRTIGRLDCPTGPVNEASVGVEVRFRAEVFSPRRAVGMGHPSHSLFIALLIAACLTGLSERCARRYHYRRPRQRRRSVGLTREAGRAGRRSRRVAVWRGSWSDIDLKWV
jgi:hypothetical protein